MTGSAVKLFGSIWRIFSSGRADLSTGSPAAHAVSNMSTIHWEEASSGRILSYIVR